jgi:hypothetical protein
MKQAALPILVLLVVVTLAVVMALPSASVEADHYQRFRDGKSLYTLLSSSIGRGNSLQDVEELLGPGSPMEAGVEDYRESLRETARSAPDSYPDGVFEADTFMSWPGSDRKVTLQFRSGYLVNFSPEQFTTFYPSYDLAGQTELYDESAMESGIGIAGREFSATSLTQAKPTAEDSADSTEK